MEDGTKSTLLFEVFIAVVILLRQLVILVT
jgi:hypothetical protein